MRPQVVPTKQWVALIETPAFSDMKIRRTVPVLVESLCKFLTGQGEPRRTVICRRLSKFKTDCFNPLIRVVCQACDRKLNINDVFGDEIGNRRRPNMVESNHGIAQGVAQQRGEHCILRSPLRAIRDYLDDRFGHF